MKCCGNCEWSISPEIEKEILEEQCYDEDDVNRPHAGDCCIGMQHNESYYCDSHLYIEGTEEYENIVIYDEEYFGQGYIIVTKLDDEIVKFVKISSCSENGFSFFSIRGYETKSSDSPNEEFRKINISVKQNELLYELLYNFGKKLNNQKIYSIDSNLYGKNNLSIKKGIDEVSLILEKDVYGVKNVNDFIDILIGDNYSCENYYDVLNFYNELSKISLKSELFSDLKKLILK